MIETGILYVVDALPEGYLKDRLLDEGYSNCEHIGTKH